MRYYETLLGQRIDLDLLTVSEDASVRRLMKLSAARWPLFDGGDSDATSHPLSVELEAAPIVDACETARAKAEFCLEPSHARKELRRYASDARRAVAECYRSHQAYEAALSGPPGLVLLDSYYRLWLRCFLNRNRKARLEALYSPARLLCDHLILTGFTQKQLAEKVGVEASALSRQLRLFEVAGGSRKQATTRQGKNSGFTLATYGATLARLGIAPATHRGSVATVREIAPSEEGSIDDVFHQTTRDRATWRLAGALLRKGHDAGRLGVKLSDPEMICDTAVKQLIDHHFGVRSLIYRDEALRTIQDKIAENDPKLEKGVLNIGVERRAGLHMQIQSEAVLQLERIKDVYMTDLIDFPVVNNGGSHEVMARTCPTRTANTTQTEPYYA